MKRTVLLLSMIMLCALCADARTHYRAGGRQMDVQKIKVNNPEAAGIPALFAENNIQYQSIDIVNWKESFPYCPATEVAVAYTCDALLVHFRVKEEKNMRGTVTQDYGPVYKDSCVEIFFATDNSGNYYNVECNCLGYIIMEYGGAQRGREEAGPGTRERIKRWTSLGSEPIGDTLDALSWEAALVIPYSALFKHNIKKLDGKKLHANFYKCRNEGQNAHFVSWNSIQTPRPSFHRPEYFGTLKLHR